MAKERKLSPNIRLAARFHAEELIAQLLTQRDIERRLQAKFGCTPKVSNQIYHEALAALREADDLDRPTRIAAVVAQMGELYRRALKDKRFATCRSILADVRRLKGLDAPIKLDLTPPKETAEGQRSDAELQYYLTHGYYPDEAPRAPAQPAKPVAPSNPLDRLH